MRETAPFPVWLVMASVTTITRAGRVGLAGLLAAASLPALAHHSVAAAFDGARTVTIEGQVRQLELASPHSRLMVDVRAADGQTVTWVTELAASPYLRRAGWTEKSLAVGERVRLTGAPSRYTPRELYAITVTRADGSRLPLLPVCTTGR
jgi:hypothetical protein